MRLVVAALVLAALTGCGPGAPPNADEGREQREVRLVERDVEYTTGRRLDVYASSQRPSVAVVLVHGCCGTRSDLVPFAELLAARGAVVFNIDWGGFLPSSRFPDAYEDLACGIRHSRAAAVRFGPSPLPVVLVGWLDGAMAAATVAMAGDGLGRARCRTPEPSAVPDGLVGLAGFYGWTLPVDAVYVTPRAIRFLGGDPVSAPANWALATPWSSAEHATPLPTALLVSETDALADDAHRFASMLVSRGWPAQVTVLTYAGESTLVSPRSAEGRRSAEEILGLLD